MNISRMQKLTKDLIAINSVTGHEHEIVGFMESELAKRDMLVRNYDVSGGRKNLLASYEDSSPTILFNTHVDTVPPQYGPHEDAGRIYGRGACDTHGILAAQLEALEVLRTEGIDGLGMLLVVGEETDHDGARHAGECTSIGQPYILIVGEPTENKLMRSQKGRLKADLSVFGREGHSGYPERFDSAVEKLVHVLDALWREPWLHRNSEDGTTVNVTLDEGGGVDNQIPALAKARMFFRCAIPSAEVKGQFQAFLQRVEKNLGAKHSLESHLAVTWDPAGIDPIQTLSTLPGFETAAASFNTDISYFGWNCPTFLVGPGSILQAHRDLNNDDWASGEWISKKEQIAGAELYRKLVQQALLEVISVIRK